MFWCMLVLFPLCLAGGVHCMSVIVQNTSLKMNCVLGCIYLKRWSLQAAGEIAWSSNHWLTAHTATMAGAESTWSQKPRVSTWSLTRVQGPKSLNHPLLLPQTISENGQEVVQLGPELVPIWDPGALVGGWPTVSQHWFFFCYFSVGTCMYLLSDLYRLN